MKKKINDIEWKLSHEIKDNDLVNWFEKNHSYFLFYGRDIENLLSKVKIAHSRNVFLKSNSLKKVLTMNDFEKGFNAFISSENIKNRSISNNKQNIMHLYS